MQKRVHPILIRAVILAAVFCVALLVTAVLFATDNSVFHRLLTLTKHAWQPPKIFGAFHLCSLALCIVLTVTVGACYKRLQKYLDSIVFVAGLILFVLELYKQLFYAFAIGNGSYNFGILPLQFCSYALYLFLFVPLLPEGKIKNALYLFCGLFQTAGGVIVISYPLMYNQLSLCVHSMVWHSVMIATGTLILFARGYGDRYWKEILPATTVFLPTVVIAVTLNYALYPLSGNSLQPLNLFYLSPYSVTHYVLIKDVQVHLGWFPAVLCYVLLFVFLGATTVWGIVKILRKLRVLH